jgi:hypothetical protein
MAESPSHLFGQVIGNLLEEIVKPILTAFCKKHHYFLDSKGDRGSAREGKKVTWIDKYGNSHDLDFVIEKNGTPGEKGRPLAFIEVAWRRYTKHSRNKAQEIQGAILPIAEKHSWDTPLLGAIIAGVFTENSISQMQSVGFKVLYIPYDTIVAAFASEGIDVKFDEDTEDKIFKKCVKIIGKLPKDRLNKIKAHLVKANKDSIDKFRSSLELALSKMIDSVIVIPLYGTNTEFKDVDIAIAYISNYSADTPARDFKKFEIIVKYTNGDTINASFADKEKAVSFLLYLKGQ